MSFWISRVRTQHKSKDERFNSSSFESSLLPHRKKIEKFRDIQRFHFLPGEDISLTLDPHERPGSPSDDVTQSRDGELTNETLADSVSANEMSRDLGTPAKRAAILKDITNKVEEKKEGERLPLFI